MLHGWMTVAPCYEPSQLEPMNTPYNQYEIIPQHFLCFRIEVFKAQQIYRFFAIAVVIHL